MVVTTYGDGEGVKTNWLMLISKVSFIVSCGSSSLTGDEGVTLVLIFKIELVVRS